MQFLCVHVCNACVWINFTGVIFSLHENYGYPGVFWNICQFPRNSHSHHESANPWKTERIAILVWFVVFFVSFAADWLWQKDNMWQAERLHSRLTGLHTAKKNDFLVVLYYWSLTEVHCELLCAAHSELGNSSRSATTPCCLGPLDT